LLNGIEKLWSKITLVCNVIYQKHWKRWLWKREKKIRKYRQWIIGKENNNIRARRNW
jgi:hypothetical protein